MMCYPVWKKGTTKFIHIGKNNLICSNEISDLLHILRSFKNLKQHNRRPGHSERVVKCKPHNIVPKEHHHPKKEN